MRIEVRCCCDPSRVLGTVDVDDERLLQRPDGWRVPLPRPLPRFGLVVDDQPLPQRLELELGTVGVYPFGEFGPCEQRRALKSNHATVEQLSTCPSFVPLSQALLDEDRELVAENLRRAVRQDQRELVEALAQFDDEALTRAARQVMRELEVASLYLGVRELLEEFDNVYVDDGGRGCHAPSTSSSSMASSRFAAGRPPA